MCPKYPYLNRMEEALSKIIVLKGTQQREREWKKNKGSKKLFDECFFWKEQRRKRRNVKNAGAPRIQNYSLWYYDYRVTTINSTCCKRAPLLNVCILMPQNVVRKIGLHEQNRMEFSIDFSWSFERDQEKFEFPNARSISYLLR